MSFSGFRRLFNRKSLRSKKTKYSNSSTTTNSGLHTSSAMVDSTSSSPSSVNRNSEATSSANAQHRYEGGRRFHNNEKVSYLLPDDVEEDDRIHLQHWALGLAFGSNFDAPVHQALEDGMHVLDSGCGPATWTLEMAKAYPNSKFYGIDVSSRFPSEIKPGNCEFLVHNILDQFPFEENYFGYIHQRLLLLGIKAVDWPKVLENLKHSLKPGGWIELMEFTYCTSQKSGPNWQLAADFGIKMTTSAGFDPDLGSNLSKLLSDAGFTNVQTRPIDIPINHGGKVGELFWQDYKEAYKSAKPILSKMNPGFQVPGAYEKFIDGLGEECKNDKLISRWTRAFAQKPLQNDN